MPRWISAHSNTKAITELTDPSGSLGLLKANRRGTIDEDNAVVFYENDRLNIPSHHNSHLYVTKKVSDIEFKGAMLDQGSSLNIISLSILEALRVPRKNITRQPIKVPGSLGG